MKAVNKEVESNTDATISCVVTGVTQQLDTIVWTKSGTDVTTLTEDNSYVVSAGTYGSNSQTTTLTVKAAVNTADSTYTCVITSNEWLQTNKQTTVVLNVFGKLISWLSLQSHRLDCDLNRLALERTYSQNFFGP